MPTDWLLAGILAANASKFVINTSFKMLKKMSPCGERWSKCELTSVKMVQVCSPEYFCYNILKLPSSFTDLAIDLAEVQLKLEGDQGDIWTRESLKGLEEITISLQESLQICIVHPTVGSYAKENTLQDNDTALQSLRRLQSGPSCGKRLPVVLRVDVNELRKLGGKRGCTKDQTKTNILFDRTN